MKRFHATFPPLLLAILMPACGDASGDAGDGSGATASDGDSDTSEDDGGGQYEGPSGPCQLEGMFVDCTLDDQPGTVWCDEIDGSLSWGPCQTDPPCDFHAIQPGCQDCELIEGELVLTGSATCECEAPAVDGACTQTECSSSWTFSCDDCESFVGGGNCFTYSEGCESPWLGCDMNEPCSRVWAQGYPGELEPLEDTNAATCMLEALRDGTPGRYRILWGEMGDAGWMTEYVYVGAGGEVVAEWRFDCPGCWNWGSLGRTGTLTLQETSWFDDCLADPTDANLIACLVGLSDHPEQLPPAGYLPPFTTGSCGSLEPACP